MEKTQTERKDEMKGRRQNEPLKRNIKPNENKRDTKGKTTNEIERCACGKL